MDNQDKKEKLSRMAMAMGIPVEQVRSENYENSEIFSSQLRSNVKDPQITIRPDGIQFNNACIRIFEDVVYVYIGLDREKKWIMVNECERDDIDSHRWCNVKDEKLESRKITGRDYADRIYRLMGWNKGYYYKVVGDLTTQEGDETMKPYMLFELKSYKQIALTEKGRAAAGVSDEDVGEEELAKIRADEEAAEREKEAAIARGETPKRRQRYTIGGIDEDSVGTPRKDHVKKRVITKGQNVENIKQMSLDDYIDTGGGG